MEYRKCILLEITEFKDIIRNITDGLKIVDVEHNISFRNSGKAINSKKSWNEDMYLTLSKYFKVNIESIYYNKFNKKSVCIVYN